MAAWAVEQQMWGKNAAKSFDLHKPPILKKICSMFESLNASALVATATLDDSLYRAGAIDGTDDVPSMARTDLVWSMAASFILGSLVLEVHSRNREVGTIDVYFDPKSLKSAHTEAWQKTLRGLLVKEARRFVLERGLRQLKKLNIRRIEPVTKTDHLAGGTDKFETGTWVADKLCTHFDELQEYRECSRRVARLDMSESVRRTTQQFDGKSFYDS